MDQNDHDHAVAVGIIGGFGVLLVTGAIVNRVRDRKLSKEGRKLKSKLETMQRADAAKIHENISNGTYTKAMMDQLAVDCEFAKIVTQEV